MKLLLGRLLSVRYCDMFPTGFKAMLLVLAKHSRAEEMTEEVGEMTHATTWVLKRALAHPLTVPSIKEQQNLLCLARQYRIEFKKLGELGFDCRKHLLINKCHQILGNQFHFIGIMSLKTNLAEKFAKLQHS